MVCTTGINTEKYTSTTEEIKRDRLFAQWLIMDNRLVCRWILAKD